MTTAQVTLSDEESDALQTLSRIKGVDPEVLLHEAVDSYLGHNKPGHRLTVLRSARGIWSERHDLPNLAELRREWDRREVERDERRFDAPAHHNG